MKHNLSGRIFSHSNQNLLIKEPIYLLCKNQEVFCLVKLGSVGKVLMMKIKSMN